jgi:hypothetical protein
MKKVTNCVGGVNGPSLANVYLHCAFDEWIEQGKGWQAWERYADDINPDLSLEKLSWETIRHFQVIGRSE